MFDGVNPWEWPAGLVRHGTRIERSRYRPILTQKKGPGFLPAPSDENLIYNDDEDADLGVSHVDQVVLLIDFFDVAIVFIGPVCRPRVDEFEPIAAKLEAPVISALDVKSMFTPETGAETVFRNATATMVGIAT